MKTKNYIGKHDENRGIILFCILFVVIVCVVVAYGLLSSSSTNEKGLSTADSIADVVETEICDITTFELNSGVLTLGGILEEEINNTILTRLQEVDIVLKDEDGDRYEYSTDYYVSTDGIEFTTFDDENSSISLENIQEGEYFVLLRLKYESSNADEGYRYRYYTLRNGSQNSTLNYYTATVYFGSTQNVETYLTIVK